MSLSSKDDFGKLQDSLTYALGQQHQTNKQTMVSCQLKNEPKH